MERIYDFTVSGIDGNGQQFISGMLEPERLDSRGLRVGKGFGINLYHKQQKSVLIRFDWVSGVPHNIKEIATFKGEILCESEVIPVLEKYNLIQK